MTTGRINQITTRFRHAEAGQVSTKSATPPEHGVPEGTSSISPSKTYDLELRTDLWNVTQPSLALLCATSFLELSLPTDRHTNDASTQINVATAQTDGQQRVIRFRPTRRCHCSTSQRSAEGATTTNASLPILANVTQAAVEIFRYWLISNRSSRKMTFSPFRPLTLRTWHPTYIGNILLICRDFRPLGWAWPYFQTFVILLRPDGQWVGWDHWWCHTSLIFMRYLQTF